MFGVANPLRILISPVQITAWRADGLPGAEYLSVAAQLQTCSSKSR
jgi:hypothetical protein